MPNLTCFKTHEEYLEWYRVYRERNREKLRAYHRQYNKLWRKENGYHNERKWKKQNPNKVIVERKLQYAVQANRIKRQPCEICGSPRSHGHHPDYSKPLKVVWLCALCHKREHKRQSVSKVA